MTRDLLRTAGIFVAVLTLLMGAAAAAPAVDGTTDDSASIGPPDGLPNPVPDFVSNILNSITEFLQGLLGGEAADGGAVPAASDSGTDGTSEDETVIETSDTDSTSDTSTTGDTDTTTNSTATVTETEPFTLAIDSIEECGDTCRDVTSTLTNQQDTTAEDVTVTTRIYAGNGTDGDQVWEDSESIGTLDAGASYTTTKRVDLSLTDAFAVDQEDGWITIETTIQTADRTVTITQQRQVA